MANGPTVIQVQRADRDAIVSINVDNILAAEPLPGAAGEMTLIQMKGAKELLPVKATTAQVLDAMSANVVPITE